MHYAIRSGRSVPYALFFAPPVIEGDALKMLCSRCREHTTYREHEGSRRCGPATLGRLASKALLPTYEDALSLRPFLEAVRLEADIAGFENWQTNATEDPKDRLRRENAAVAYAAAEAGIEPPKRRRAPVEAVNACHGTITAEAEKIRNSDAIFEHLFAKKEEL